MWCHVRHINPVKICPEKITKEDKNLVNDVDYDGIVLPVQEKDFSKIEKKKTTFALMYLVMKIDWFFNLRFRRKIWKVYRFGACI